MFSQIIQVRDFLICQGLDDFKYQRTDKGSLLKVMSSRGIQKHRKFQMFHPSLKVFDQVSPSDSSSLQRSTEFKDLNFKLHSQSENIFVIAFILISYYSAWDHFYLIISSSHQVCSDRSTNNCKDGPIRTKKRAILAA